VPDGDLGDLVRAAARDWVWVPPDARDVTTVEYRLTHYPWYSTVQWARPERPVREILDEVRELVRAVGATRLRWWVVAGDDPAVEHALAELGLRNVETVDVFGLDLRPGVEELVERLDLPVDVTVRPADDEASLRLAGRISSAAFDEPPPSEALLAREVGLAAEGLRTGRWSSRQFIAEIDGDPVGMGGAGCIREAEHGPTGVLRLWGAGVLPQARGRGAYRALLAERCRFGADQAMTLALVKGRVTTSGPVLRRAGFGAFGQERCYETRLDPGAREPSGASTAR
jgi:hypothetical protein